MFKITAKEKDLILKRRKVLAAKKPKTEPKEIKPSPSSVKKMKEFLDLRKRMKKLNAELKDIGDQSKEFEGYFLENLEKYFNESEELLVSIEEKTVRMLRWTKGNPAWKQAWDELYNKVNKSMQQTMDEIGKAHITFKQYITIEEKAEGSIKDTLKKAWDKVKNFVKKLISSFKNMNSSLKQLNNSLEVKHV